MTRLPELSVFREVNLSDAEIVGPPELLVAHEFR
jgi:hypothetical protein